MTAHVRPPAPLLALLLACSWACGSGSSRLGLTGLTPSRHPFFPVAGGIHAAECASCHISDASFTQFSCVGCHAHDQGPTDRVHVGVAGYSYASTGCYGCHPSAAHQTYSHAGVSGDCAGCHAEGASFAALPISGFTHRPTPGQDCSGCHTVIGWKTGATPGDLAHDPAHDLTVVGLIPSYAGTSIAAVTPQSETLSMGMDHATGAVDPGTLASCAGCHDGAAGGSYYPGAFHASLPALAVPQPATCLDCHAGSAPAGFVGPPPTRPARSPASGEMKHDAVEWANGVPTASRSVTAECGVCHATPTGTAPASWTSGRAGPLAFHRSLDAAQLANPSTCLDCHASSRPGAVLTSGTAALPARVTFDHGAQAALAECATCHSASRAGWSSWAGGRFHLAGGATPSSCLPCHAGERPTSTAGWTSATYAASPFDYGTNPAGITHGDGKECVGCHAGPGTGAWGSTQSWSGGRFDHGPASPAATTCVACHMSQRPDLQAGTTAAAAAAAIGFDHALNGTGDCFGCHQATVLATRYVNYLNPATRRLPGGDWAGGAFYPGATPVSAPGATVTLDELTLTRSGALVTGFTTATAMLFGAMTHLSPAIPAAVSPGPAASPDTATCWHCHTSVNGTVTSYSGGRFHAALTAYSATPGGAVRPLPQPATRCADCHANMRPAGIVERAGSPLQPMDHGALFAGLASVGGATVTGVAGIDCSACHAHPGDTWADGVFHARIGGAVPQDCTVCHYLLMATAAADVTSGTRYAMSHRSPPLAFQRCDLCHGAALGRSTLTPPAAALWQTGTLHASVGTQPSACLGCHRGSAPPAATQGSTVYSLPSGSTSTNGYQWMSHAVAGVVGVECASCHAVDARAVGAAWSKSTPYHAKVAAPGSCQSCHGLSNGNGATAGTGNNLPFGLTDSSTLTTASSNAATGVPAGTHDQLVHTDLNAASHDCGFCHTQVGPSTVAGVQGREWAQARFHTAFTASSPPVMDGVTGRCSNCHMNVRPGAGITAQNHSGFSNASGTQDCSSCHSWPGTGTPAAPNWITVGAPQTITVGGFTIPDPPSSPPSTQPGIAGLPHPSTATVSCASCHSGGAGGRRAMGYDHASTLIDTNCGACHEAGSDLVGTPWNGATAVASGAGDTRPFTLPSVQAQGNTETYPNHFYLDRAGARVDCRWCHRKPTGVSAATTGTTYRSAWAFHHPPQNSTQNFCYQCHANGIPN